MRLFWRRVMSRQATLKRKSFFVNEASLQRARKLLGVGTDAAAVRRPVGRVAEVGAFGRFIRSVGDAEGWETSKRRDFQNDALIGLTARRQGAVVVTANWRDFDVLAEELAITVIGP